MQKHPTQKSARTSPFQLNDWWRGLTLVNRTSIQHCINKFKNADFRKHNYVSWSNFKLHCMCHKKPYNEKNEKKKDGNNNQNINKQTPTCTCPSINKLTAGALVICKKNRYAHWDKASFYHLFDTEIIASTGSDITIQLANFFFLTCSGTFWQNYISGIFKIMILGG